MKVFRMNFCISVNVIIAVLLTTAQLSSCTDSQNELICDGKRQWKFKLIESKILTCMIQHTETTSRNYTLKTLRDEFVHGISFRNNTKLEYLPTNVFEKFPNLWIYDAQGCSLKLVEKLNFHKLFNLTAVDLSYNLIDHIPKDLFEDSTSIHIINISTYA